MFLLWVARDVAGPSGLRWLMPDTCTCNADLHERYIPTTTQRVSLLVNLQGRAKCLEDLILLLGSKSGHTPSRLDQEST